MTETNTSEENYIHDIDEAHAEAILLQRMAKLNQDSSYNLFERKISELAAESTIDPQVIKADVQKLKSALKADPNHPWHLQLQAIRLKQEQLDHPKRVEYMKAAAVKEYDHCKNLSPAQLAKYEGFNKHVNANAESISARIMAKIKKLEVLKNKPNPSNNTITEIEALSKEIDQDKEISPKIRAITREICQLRLPESIRNATVLMEITRYDELATSTNE